MITTNDYVRFTISTDSYFESAIVSCVVNAFDMGARNKKAVICLNDYDDGYVDIEGTVQSKAILEHAINAIRSHMNRYEQDIKTRAINDFKHRNKLPDDMK